VYDYIRKLYRQQSEVMQNHEDEHIHGIGQSEARRRKCGTIKLVGGQAYDLSSDHVAVVAYDT
jgi:hypothetical protein